MEKINNRQSLIWLLFIDLIFTKYIFQLTKKLNYLQHENDLFSKRAKINKILRFSRDVKNGKKRVTAHLIDRSRPESTSTVEFR